jgi:hypothetical protein
MIIVPFLGAGFCRRAKIITFFRNGMTNAKAGWIKGKIRQFVSNNYELKDKDFFLYPLVNYFS